MKTNKIRRTTVAVTALLALGAGVAACTPPTGGGGTGATTTTSSTNPTQTTLPQG